MRWSLAALGLALLTAACNGWAPLITCRDPCSDPKETRDSFCVCRDYTGIGGPTPPPPPPLEPYFHKESVASSCLFQKRRWIFNPRNQVVDVRVGKYERDGSLSGRVEYYWHTVKAKAETKASGVDLGLDYDGSDCFDHNFFISTWRSHRSADAALSGTRVSLPNITDRAAMLSAEPEIDPATAEFRDILLERFKREVEQLNQNRKAAGLVETLVPYSERRVINRRDCSIECNQIGTCQRHFPPDAAKIAALRDRVLATSAGTTLQSSAVYAIFGLSQNYCSRSDTPKSATSKVSNDGDVCSYPIFLKGSETQPAAAIVIGNNVEALSMGRSDAGSLMFNKPYATPMLSFLSSVAQTEYGGKILEMSADKTGVYFNAGANCTFLGIQ